VPSDSVNDRRTGVAPDEVGAAAFIFQDTAIRYVNPAATVMTGFSREELLGMPFWEVIHPDDRAVVRERGMARQQGEPVPWHYEVRIRRKDECVRWVQFSAGEIEYDGRPAVLGTAIDVTERKAAAERLRESERRFRALAENSSDLVVLTDAAGHFRYLGPSVGRILGFQPEELIGRDGLAPVHRADRDRVRAAYAELARRPGSRACAVYRVRHRDGSWRWLESVATNLLDDPAVAAIIINSRDVTDREEAVAAYRSLVDNSLQGLMILQGLRIVFANPAIATMTGYTVDELRALPPERIGDILHPDDRELVRRRVLSRLAGEPVGTRSEHRFLHPDATVRWVEAHASLTDYGGRPAVQVAYIDISDRKVAEESARRHQHELAHVLRRRTLGEMAAVFAHEVNQPLTAIANYATGCARRLRSDMMAPDQMLGVLDEIAGQAVRAGEIIRRLRGFVRRVQPQRQETQLNELIDEVVHFVTAEARDHGVRLRVDHASGLPPVPLDVVLIEQVALNLMRNALDAMYESASEQPQLAIRTRQLDGQVEVAISDTGPGLLPEVAADIFEPFVTSKPDGLGMGLSICRSIIDAHGGRVWATPNPEGGMTFAFTLPLAPRDE
jgi:PAS domain S-box-containing protein